MQSESNALPPINAVTAGVTAGVTADIDYRVVGGNVEQQCNPDPFSVSVHECLPSAASKDGETLRGEGGSAVTRPPAIGVSACDPADPPCVSVPVGRPPAASKDDEASGGDGGCTARALTAIDVFPSTSAAVRGLDAEIAPLHQKLYRERGECDESDAGIRGEQWHQEAVKRAVVAAGWHFKTLPINPTQPACVDLKTALASGSYLVVGVTNNQWYKGRKKQPLKYPEWPADAPAMDMTGWVHSIAIVDGHVCDFQTRQPLSALWLESNNQPHPRKGYMRTIRKVWKLHRCSRRGTGCKGACVAK